MLNSTTSFKVASLLIKLIALLIAVMLLAISKYALIFFLSAILPTICIIFFETGENRCLSATICSFNLMGIMPYLIRIWSSSSIEYESKEIISDISTWFTIYGTTLMGQVVYIFLPLMIAKIHVAKIKITMDSYKQERNSLLYEWGIEEEETIDTQPQNNTKTSDNTHISDNIQGKDTQLENTQTQDNNKNTK